MLKKESQIKITLSNIRDLRMEGKVKHPIEKVIIIAAASTLCGSDNYKSMELFGRNHFAFFNTFLNLRNGIPSHDTFRRVINKINHKELENLFRSASSILPTEFFESEHIAIDGKTIRGSASDGKNAAHVVGAYRVNDRMSLGQVLVDEKSNEITAIPKLIKSLISEGAIITCDAMGCQKDIARCAINAKANYVLALKDNHPIFHDHAKELLKILETEEESTGVRNTHIQRKTTIEKNAGRIEKREYTQLDDLSFLYEAKNWVGIKSICRVESSTIIKEKEYKEKRMYISSLPLNIESIASIIRKHWGIENGLHYVLDTAYREDLSRARTLNAPMNLSILRRLSLNVLRHFDNVEMEKLSTKNQQRYIENHNEEILKGIKLMGFVA